MANFHLRSMTRAPQRNTRQVWPGVVEVIVKPSMYIAVPPPPLSGMQKSELEAAKLFLIALVQAGLQSAHMFPVSSGHFCPTAFLHWTDTFTNSTTSPLPVGAHVPPWHCSKPATLTHTIQQLSGLSRWQPPT